MELSSLCKLGLAIGCFYMQFSDQENLCSDDAGSLPSASLMNLGFLIVVLLKDLFWGSNAKNANLKYIINHRKCIDRLRFILNVHSP